MKRLVLGIVGIVVIAAIGAGIWYYLLPEQVAHRAIERYAGAATGTDVRVRPLKLSPADGAGTMNGFSIRNPAGYRTPNAFEADVTRITVELETVQKGTLTVRTLFLIAPRIYLEAGDKGSNLDAIFGTILRQADLPGRKIIVDRVVIQNARLILAPAADASQQPIALPEIRLNNLGREEGGITTARLALAIAEPLIYHVRRLAPAAARPATAGTPAASTTK
jgi:hypothetical protein